MGERVPAVSSGRSSEDEPSFAPPRPSVQLDVVPIRFRPACRAPGLDAAARWEAEMAAGMSRGKEAARQRVECHAPIGEALASPALSLPWTVRGAAGLLGGADPGEVLDQILSSDHVPPSRLVVTDATGADITRSVQPGRPDFAVVRPVLPETLAVVADGGALSVTGAEEHDRRLNRLFIDLDRLCGATTWAELSLVGAGASHPSPPTDAARIVICWEGECVVTTHGRPDSGSPLPRVERLVSGDGLVVPSGWGTQLSGDGGVALVLAAMLPVFTLRNALQSIMDEMVFWPLLRADLPVDLDRPVNSYAGWVLDEPGLGSILLSVLTSGGLDRARSRLRAEMGARWSAGLFSTMSVVTSQFSAGSLLRCPIPGGFFVPEADTPNPTVFGNRRRISGSESELRALAILSDGEDHAVEDLRFAAPDTSDPALATDWSRDVASRLVEAGLAEVAS